MSTGFTNNLAAWLMEHPNEWFDGARDLAPVGGVYAWRSRVSDARRRFKIRIENRQLRRTRPDGTSFIVSQYRYVPDPPSTHRQVDL